MSDMNKKITVGIIDLKINNIFSVYRGCVRAGFKTEIINFKRKKLIYDIVILPGVGAFKSGIQFLKQDRINEKIKEYLERENSFIYGTCLGMQLLFEKSFEFEKTKGLNLIKGNVIKFSKIENRLTHLGWNKISFQESKFKSDLRKFENKYFYFIHSYYAKPESAKDVLGITRYGSKNFCSVVKKGKIFGTQFHPEKSGHWGIEFLKNLKNIKN